MTRLIHLVALLAGLQVATPLHGTGASAPLTMARNADGQYLFIRPMGDDPRIGSPKGTGLPEARFFQYDRTIHEAAQFYAIDPLFIKAILLIESGFRPKAVSHDKRGRPVAYGMAQMIPSTAARLGVKDPTNPTEAIWGCAAYLRRLSDRFAGSMVLMAAGYNAGEGAVEDAGRKIPPFKETQNYVPAVLWVWDHWHRIHQKGRK